MKYLIHMVILLLAISFFFLPGAVAENKKLDREEWLEKEREKARLEKIEYFANLNMPFEFYGQVTDLDGNVVAGAEVTVRLAFSPPTPMLADRKLIKRTTDSEGRFKIVDTGYYVGLVEIHKDGYYYHYKYNKIRGFRFIKGKKKAELGQVESQPVVFKVRKKGPPAVVLTGQASFQLQPGPSSIRLFDLLKQSWTYPRFLETEKLNFKDWHEDLTLSLGKEDNIYQLIFKALDDDTGIVMGELEQYEAPRKGYRPELVIMIPETEPTTQRWLFVEGRGGAFYSMLQVETHPSEKWVNVRIGYGTNPNGSRNLEYDFELTQQYLEQKKLPKRKD